ncbi:MAG: DUF6600 domain-containing protein [Verrucomicrobiota bacterium]
MKTMKWVGLAAVLAVPVLSGFGQTPEAPAPGAPTQAQTAAPVDLSPGAAEVVRLAGSGVGDDVVVAYIQNSQAPFNLSADDVLYLKDIGLSSQVTSAMLSHDSGLRNQPQQDAPAATTPAAPSGSAPPTYQWQSPPAPTASAPAPTVPAPALMAPAPAPTAPAPAEPTPPATAPPPVYVTSAPADVSYFYNDLSPYGTWVSLDGYGWCWQPRTVVISRGWRPYCDGGHWVYTDAGWFWQSDYSWGWAPFHYGRWYSHPRCGWVWMPDRVWGPAWVTWRSGGDACGWAPLPPHASFDVRLGWRYNGVRVGANFDFGLGINAFAFVSFGDFGNHDLGHRRFPPERVRTVYNQTTIINNYVVNNNTIVHRGIPIERVSAASRVPVTRATVRDLPAGSARSANRSGSVVYRPQLRAPTQPVNMAAQRVDTGHPVIQHAPIAPVRTQQPSTFSRSGSAPAAASRRQAVEAPKSSSWSSGTRPATTPQTQPAPRTSQRATTPAMPQAAPGSSDAKPRSSSQFQSTPRASQPATVAPAATSPARAPENLKQGTRSAPSYRSDPSQPALNKTRATSQSAPAAAQTSSPAQNSPRFYPKTDQRAAEVRSQPPSNQRQSAKPSSPTTSPNSRSGKNQ